MLPAKLPSKQLQVIWYSVINSIIHQWWSGKCYCLLPKYLYLTCTWLKKYLMSSKYSEYLNLYLYLQIWKSTCTWLKYFEKYLTPTLMSIKMLKKIIFFSRFHQVTLLYHHQCMSFWLKIYHYSSYFIFVSHNHHCPKLSATGGIYKCTGLGHSLGQFMTRLVINRFRTVWNPTLTWTNVDLSLVKSYSVHLISDGQFHQGWF